MKLNENLFEIYFSIVSNKNEIWKVLRECFLLVGDTSEKLSK